MPTRLKNYQANVAFIRSFVLIVIGAAMTIAAAFAESEPAADADRSKPTHMPEDIRSTIDKIVIIAGEPPSEESLTGSYNKDTTGLVGGMDEGSRVGTISKEVGGVPVNIPIPVLGTLGAIYGGLSGAAKREIQDFRDALTKELVRDDNPPLRSDALAQDAYFGIQRVPTIDSRLFATSTPIPDDTDAVLYVNFEGLTIDVQDSDAIITTSAIATLSRLSDGKNIYETIVRYQDRDTLSDWTDDDNALLRQYVSFARYYLGGEIAAEVISGVEVQHEIRPVKTDTAKLARKSDRKFVSESLTPTLAWELDLNGGDSDELWTENIDEADVSYDIEIFDNRQLVYYEKQLPTASHTLGYELEPCKTYRWSVRPIYKLGQDLRFGEWMRFSPPIDEERTSETEKGLYGRKASVSPAYIQDFALLEIKCKRR